MSMKRGPNSPMESEKARQQASTSAAVSTLGMAAKLSPVSRAFGGHGASSMVTDSKDNCQSQAEDQNGSDNESVRKPRTAPNLDKIKEPKKERNPYLRTSTMMEQGEIKLKSNSTQKNGKHFSGSITPLEVKHSIYIYKFGFTDHANFDGVRIGSKEK